MSSAKWYRDCFDPSWVECRNLGCKATFIRTAVYLARKCPRCRMNSKGEIKKTKKLTRS